MRVVVTGVDSGVKKLGFVYPEGPAQPRLERDLLVAGRKRATDEPEVRKAKPRKRTEGDAPTEPKPRPRRRRARRRNAADRAAGDLKDILGPRASRSLFHPSRCGSEEKASETLAIPGGGVSYASFSAAAIFAALSASFSLFSISPPGGRNFGMAQRGGNVKVEVEETTVRPPLR